MDDQTRLLLEARWENSLAKLDPELADRIRHAPPLSAEQLRVVRQAVQPSPRKRAA